MSYTIGARIRAYREKCGITQRELAEQIGVQYAVISNWETGRNRPNVDILLKLCDAFCTTADELLGLQKSESDGFSPEAIRVAKKFDGAEEKKRKIVVEILDL